MSRSVDTNLELLKALVTLEPKSRFWLLSVADKSLVTAICECALNVLNGNVCITSRVRNTLYKHRDTIRMLARPKVKCWKKLRLIILKNCKYLIPLLIKVSLVHLEREEEAVDYPEYKDHAAIHPVDSFKEPDALKKEKEGTIYQDNLMPNASTSNPPIKVTSVVPPLKRASDNFDIKNMQDQHVLEKFFNGIRRRCALCYEGVRAERGSKEARKATKRVVTFCKGCDDNRAICLECFYKRH